MQELAHIAKALALLSSGALLGAALYDAVVLAPNLRGGPTGLEHGRLFMTAATPANLFRRLAPATQILVLLSVAANWPNSQARWTLVVALGVLILSDVITLKYHYPRNRLLFTAPLNESPQRLAVAAKQWATANLVRIALVLIAWLCVLSALVRTAA
jgi:Domain of unknown function (DUF1772)